MKCCKTYVCISIILLVSGVFNLVAAQNKEDKVYPISKTLDELGHIKVKARESDVPAPVMPLLTKLKHELRDLISETINDDGLNWKSPDELKLEIISKLKKEGITLSRNNSQENDNGEYSYNKIQDVSIEKIQNHTNLIVATTTLWVMCGEDTSFYIFKKQNKKWNLLLAEEAEDYNDITGAHSWFSYSVAPYDRNGNFYIVTANVNPWCTSNWQELRYKVYRIGHVPYSPKVLLTKSDTIYVGINPPIYKIATKVDRFTLKFYGDWYLSGGVDASPQYVTYRIVGDNVKLLKKGKLKGNMS